jgi:hypothetical protein
MARKEKSPEPPDPIPRKVLDRLYGVAPEEFVATRNAAAAELKQAGDSAGADAVRALRRPSAPAAAINRAVRDEPAQARALLDAGRDVRRAHEALLAGKGDSRSLKAATAAERQAVSSLARSAARGVGGTVSADVERRIRDTLEAVALDQDVRDRFTAGRLERDARAAGLAAELLAGRPAPARKVPATDRARAKAEQRERRRLEDAVRRAQATLETRRQEVADAERAREHADATLREARKRVKTAEANLRAARRAVS